MKVIGSNITITDSVVNKMDILPLGNCEQDGTPTPDNPIDVKVVTGDNQVVVQNKNLLDLDKSEANGINSSGQNVNVDRNWRSNVFITIKPNTNYIFSVKSAEILRLYEYDENGNFISPRHELSNADTSLSITTYQNAKYLKWTIFVTDQQTVTKQTIINLEPQIELGSTATSYVDHQEQTYTLHLGSLELCKIGDYQDVILGSKDNWKVVRKVGKVIYTGASDENWIYEQNNNGFLILNTLTNLKDLTDYDATKIPDFICNQYIPVSYNSYIGGSIGISERYFNNTDFLRVKSSLTDASAFKTYLSNNNLLLYYPIATPTEETITDTSLVQSLNELQELLSYDGTTNITITSDSNNAQMSVEVTYTSESDMNEKLAEIFNSIKSKLYHIIRAL